MIERAAHRPATDRVLSPERAARAAGASARSRPLAQLAVCDRRPPRRRLFGIALAAAIAAILMAPRHGRADVTAECDFIEFSGTSGDKPAIDGELQQLEKKLKKPPFSTWNQFKLLARSHKALAKKKPEPISLKNGSATATLVEIVDKSKVRLTVTMDDAKGKQVANNTATVEAGDYVIYVHPLPRNEGHLLSVSCK